MMWNSSLLNVVSGEQCTITISYRIVSIVQKDLQKTEVIYHMIVANVSFIFLSELAEKKISIAVVSRGLVFILLLQ